MQRQKVSADVAMGLPSFLFEDRFLVRSVDNSKFEKVGRIRAKSSGFDAEIILDVNIDIYPVTEKESLTIGITSQIAAQPTTEAAAATHVYSLIGTSSETEEGGPRKKPANLMDLYDYVMYGKIFKLEEKPSDRRTIYASFGGLLMSLTADKQVVGELDLDRRIYILIRRKQEY